MSDPNIETLRRYLLVGEAPWADEITAALTRVEADLDALRKALASAGKSARRILKNPHDAETVKAEAESWIHRPTDDPTLMVQLEQAERERDALRAENERLVTTDRPALAKVYQRLDQAEPIVEAAREWHKWAAARADWVLSSPCGHVVEHDDCADCAEFKKISSKHDSAEFHLRNKLSDLEASTKGAADGDSEEV